MSAYDQTKGELCEKCGWAMKFPDELCRCELERENAALRDLVARMAAEMREVDHEFASLRDYDAAQKEEQPIRADHSGDITEMIQLEKKAQQ